MTWYRTLQACAYLTSAVFAAWVIYGAAKLLLSNRVILVGAGIGVVVWSVAALVPLVVDEFRRIFQKDAL